MAVQAPRPGVQPSAVARSATWRPLVATLLAFALLGAACTDADVDGDTTPATPEHTPPPEPDLESDPEPEPLPEPSPEPQPDPEPEPDAGPGLGAHGVSAGDQVAVDAGMQVLEAGGNAVDAAIATAFSVAVVEPFASGVGGGGAALVATVDGQVESYDYREVVAQDGVVPASGTGVPGFVAGMVELHADHGELSWEELLEPAIALAADGATTSTILAAQLRTGAPRLPTGDLPDLFPDGQPLDVGEAFQQPDLAATLQAIADDGRDAVYTADGAFGAQLVADVEGIDAASLESYDVQRTDPPRGPFAGFEVVAAAPPLPGAALIQLLQVAEALDIADAPLGTADHLHRVSMAWLVADRSVATELGDPAFVDVPVERLTDRDTNAEVAATISDDTILATTDGHPTVPLALRRGDDSGAATDGVDTAGNTTHITTVDADGTVVSMTNTITNFWGSGQQVGGAFLNDQLSRFSVGGDTNVPEPGRRSVSWSLPVIVLDETGRPVLGLGSPGGRRIPTIEGGLLIRWALHGQSLQEAVDGDRAHLDDGVLFVESLPDADVIADLSARGYTDIQVPAPVYYFGSVQALEIDHDAGIVTGAQDPRRDGTWAASSSD